MKKKLKKILNVVCSVIDLLSRSCIFFVVLIISLAAINSLYESTGIYFSIIWLFVIILAGLRIATFSNFIQKNKKTN